MTDQPVSEQRFAPPRTKPEWSPRFQDVLGAKLVSSFAKSVKKTKVESEL